jgi:RNA polymerase sigma-70 factor (ECF subfamily)
MTMAQGDRDTTMVAALLEGTSDGVERLVATYGARVHRLAARVTGNAADADEVAQDALWTAARKIGTFRGRARFSSWLYRITLNAAYQRLRRDRGRRRVVAWDEFVTALEAGGPAAPLAPAAAAMVDTAPSGDVRATLARALDRLPAGCRAALVMHTDGHSAGEIAAALNISVPAARSRLHRSRLRVRAHLADAGPSGRRPRPAVSAPARTP